MTTLTHLDDEGRARMVNVGEKPVTARRAVASGEVRMRPETLEKIRTNSLAKGDVLAVARVAGILAAKRCDELIPLCHSLPLDSVDIDFELDDALPGVRVSADAQVHSRTGVEMEALTAVSIAAMTIYDMCKAVDKGMVIEKVCLLRKEGGRSGVWERSAASESGPGEGEE
ncbi:cyclic pyranopterin monophosphate synthase MoaC [Congregibacter litoralis]|uniref:Cyclic pyranopterin monophosphate synthase n=1 Tax=Congregibacter litoralis KT71 TaxID=314285 RepID=A4A3E2_9GAMM|nr:cyclic pyranopterin monophosphate synthase MoaC [Congregibacter litoralis]EAQ99215.1 cyclic pyranopterin monophosphate synthase subunit MoaC [Congregibacter litoralis KT71]